MCSFLAIYEDWNSLNVDIDVFVAVVVAVVVFVVVVVIIVVVVLFQATFFLIMKIQMFVDPR